ncbi:uncharacterized protein LOC135849170 isoform X3 [Planococcus citri]|uniref:uncharacterized protein LOC135849170 isoform X3 n=1 Tax=Planococcus citri TaxID=170843 RepID=UPI0031F91793
MDTKNSSEATAAADHQKPKKLIRSQFKDVMVKVDEDIYYLNRLRLALESGYFEKLFTEDYRDRNCDFIEIPMMDSDTFSAAVDLIYGRDLRYVINDDNFASVLMAMDYFQMDIYEGPYREILDKDLGWGRPFNDEVFKLYRFIVETGNYQRLLSVVFQHLSLHILKLQGHDEYLSIPFDHYIHIISQQGFHFYEERFKKHEFSEVCAKWICHDIENRLPRIIELVNAARYRNYCPNKLSYDDTNLRLPAIDEFTNVDKVSRYFYKFFTYPGEISRIVDEPKLEVYEDEKYQDFHPDEEELEQLRYNQDDFSEESEHHDWNVPYHNSKLEAFLRNGQLFDITIKADEKLYKLHRAVLNAESLYFKEMFSIECSELAAQCEGTPPTPPSKDKIYFMDDIDSVSFDSIVESIYKLRKQAEFTTGGIVRLFKAAHKLKIDDLRYSCESWMKSNSEGMCVEDAIEMLNFTREHVEYKSLNQFFLSKYVVDSWPKIDNLPQFADLFKAISLPTCEENKVDLSDKTDQESFKLIIDYMYLDSVKVEDGYIWQFLKASEFFRIEKLVEECAEWFIRNERKIKSEDVVKVLNFARRNIKCREALNSVYLAKYMIKWPNVDSSLFCSISYNCLENLLTSREFFLDDTLEILDMCSKWVMHDVENRYCLIPRIALAISQNRLVDCDDYPISSPPDFNNCSQDFIKEKLWETLTSTSVLPFAVLSKDESIIQKTGIPVFITWESERGLFKIFDSNWDEIDLFLFHKNIDTFDDVYPMSACIINDNVFLRCGKHNKSGFYVFNLSSKKLFSLASDPRLFKIDHNWTYSDSFKYTLLNCRNEMYNCLEDGEIFKYSFKLNRWIRFAEPELDKDGLRFASDGKKLYRMYKIAQTDRTTDFVMEEYNFEQKSWISVPNSRLQVNMRSFVDGSKYWVLHELIHLNDNGFAALFKGQLFRFDQQEETWRNVYLRPYSDYHSVDLYSKTCIIGQNETGQMLFVINNLLYCLNRSPSYDDWVLIKEWPIIKNSKQTTTSYFNIVAIHTPCIHV